VISFHEFIVEVDILVPGDVNNRTNVIGYVVVCESDQNCDSKLDAANLELRHTVIWIISIDQEK